LYGFEILNIISFIISFIKLILFGEGSIAYIIFVEQFIAHGILLSPIHAPESIIFPLINLLFIRYVVIFLNIGSRLGQDMKALVAQG